MRCITSACQVCHVQLTVFPPLALQLSNVQIFDYKRLVGIIQATHSQVVRVAVRFLAHHEPALS